MKITLKGVKEIQGLSKYKIISNDDKKLRITLKKVKINPSVNYKIINNEKGNLIITIKTDTE